MGASKTEEFTLRDVRLAAYAKALSHPARVAILRLLAERSSCFCGDIVEQLPLSQSTVSQHLKELKEAGLISGEIDGKNVCYCINQEAMQQVQAQMSSFFTCCKPGTGCC
jgi:DNA-binding transcriptional ArsR family regulator